MRLFPLLLLILLCTCGRAQSSEFEIHNNGFIYPEATMTDLGMIVDSLDLKFKQCDLNRVYRAPAQAMANCYTIKNADWEKVRDQLTKAAAAGKVEVEKVFPKAKLTRRGILYESPGSKHSPGRQYNLLPLNYGNSLSIKVAGDESARITDRLYVGKGYKETHIWVFDAVPTPIVIPDTYARLIQYVDCMVDTAQNIYREKAVEATGGYLADDKDDKAGEKLLKLAGKYPGKQPESLWEKNEDPTGEEIEAWQAANEAYRTGQVAWVREQASKNPNMTAAIQHAITNVQNGYSLGERAEQYLEACGEYAVALESKRLRRVYGSCSQDQSPRIHAMQIARLSAASVEWSVFLRAHLNIMNDRFDRVSDGSYAYGRRGTYLGEVEALGIDATGLLIGSCLKAEGLSENHYSSSWARVGRALREAGNTDAVIDLLTKIIRDPELDDLNRMTGVYLLRYMASNYGQEKTDERYTQALAAAVAGLDNEWVSLVKVE